MATYAPRALTLKIDLWLASRRRPFTVLDLAGKAGLDYEAARRRVYRLRAAGRVEAIGGGKWRAIP